MPAAGYIFHYSRSEAPPPALPLIDLIGDVLRSGWGGRVARELSAAGSATRPSVVIISRALTTATQLQYRR